VTTLILEITFDERMALICALTMAVRQELREMELVGPRHELAASAARCTLARARCWLDIASGLEMEGLEREMLRLVEACEARAER
jgi:hypothetical protein